MTQHLFNSTEFDSLIVADFTCSGDLAYRLAQEVRFLHAQNQRVGLVQTRAPKPDASISAEVRTCLRRGLASIASSHTALNTENLIIHEPAIANWSALANLGGRLRQIAVICHNAADLFALCPDFGKSAVVRSFVTNSRLRMIAERPLEPRDWLPPPIRNQAKPRLSRLQCFGVGWLSTNGLTEGETMACLRATADCTFQSEHFRLGSEVKLPLPRLPDLSLDRLTYGLDALVYIPEEESLYLPDMQIAAALSLGLSVVLPKHLKAHYGRGPIYTDPCGLSTVLIKRIMAPLRKAARADLVIRTRSAPLIEFAPERRAFKIDVESVRPVLCLAANGVGIGHLTRLLAIARRMSGPVVFVTQAPAVGVVQDFGFPVHYIPSAAAVGGEFELWDDWFEVQLDGLLDLYDPSMVVYDGNHPSWGLIKAVTSRRDCRLSWVRRGMWANTTSDFLRNTRWCDLVIEPGDLADAYDNGVTAKRKHEALQVNPIRLLDESDLIERSQSAALLGLNPARPAVLIQLGSGYNRDLLALLDEIITVLAAFPGLQIALAEWVTGTMPLGLWPHVVVLRGFPLSQYIRAFDFCISAAGYNSFHELIGFGVPTVFIANKHPSMDDQYGRAKFAQDAAAAFEISEDDLSELPELINVLMHEASRQFLTSNCGLFELPNGAVNAANALSALSEACSTGEK